MNHTIKQILKNQDTFEHEIKTWLKTDFKLQKKTLALIDPDGDEAIEKAQEALKDKLAKIRVNKVIKSLFFKSGLKKRSKKYYAWWDEEKEEVIIHTYAKAIASINRPGVRRKPE